MVDAEIAVSFINSQQNQFVHHHICKKTDQKKMSVHILGPSSVREKRRAGNLDKIKLLDLCTYKSLIFYFIQVM